MKISWTSIKISIAGAKLSHLVQRDKIWDHGSMTEQARIIFYLVYKAKASGNMDSLKRQCSISGFAQLKNEMEKESKKKDTMDVNPVIKELVIVEVHPGKKSKPDMFCSLIKFHLKKAFNGMITIDQSKEFVAKWCFTRQGDWWVLNETK